MPIILSLKLTFVKLTVFVIIKFITRKIEPDWFQCFFRNCYNLAWTLSYQIVFDRRIQIIFWKIVSCWIMSHCITIEFTSKVSRSHFALLVLLLNLNDFLDHAFNDEKYHFWSLSAFNQVLPMRYPVDNKSVTDCSEKILCQIRGNKSCTFYFLQNQLFFDVNHNSYFKKFSFW